MKITVTPVSGGAIVLGDDSAAWYISHYARERAYTVQTAQPVRAAWVRLFPRGLKMEVLTFTVERLHASDSAAKAFVDSHIDAIPESGTVTIENGTNTRTVNFTLVKVNPTASNGASTSITYTLHCTQ